MKKMLIISLSGFFVFVVGILTLFALICGSDGTKPIITILDEEQAYQYYSISQELGVPWDLLIALDTYLADAETISIEEHNPLLTALNFCKLTVTDYKLSAIQQEESTDTNNDEETDEESGKKPSLEWKESSETVYKGTQQLLELLNLTEDAVLTDLYEAVEAYEEEMLTERSKRTVEFGTLMPEIDAVDVIALWYSDVLPEKKRTEINDIYSTGYLRNFYMEADERIRNDWIGDLDLPDITVGSVTQLQFVAVAVSIIDAPYSMGGKSPAMGAPACAMDCSGYVDWVYMQAFGETVSGGMGGTWVQYSRCAPITADQLRIGDLGFYYAPADVPEGGYNHVGIYVGQINGKPAFAHCGGSYWGYPGRDSGRVVVSINDGRTTNTRNPLGGTFPVPAMKTSSFKLFMRPQFSFSG